MVFFKVTFWQRNKNRLDGDVVMPAAAQSSTGCSYSDYVSPMSPTGAFVPAAWTKSIRGEIINGQDYNSSLLLWIVAIMKLFDVTSPSLHFFLCKTGALHCAGLW